MQGPTGLSVQVARADGLDELTLRDLPPELTELTQSPLSAGYRFATPPALALTLERQGEVELTSTIVDEIQASTLLIEDGAEVSKVRMMVRNNARQYLRAALPQGALLTVARIDGRPVRPALVPGEEVALLLPLVRSERLAGAPEQVHVVRDGESLSGIAQMYYGDAGRWGLLLDQNRDQLSSEEDLEVGQALRIPSQATARVEEKSFVIELAWTRAGAPLGWVGRRQLQLPELDVDASAVHWHVFVPDALTPLSFSGNLSQTSAIRYDPVRRLRHFLADALMVRDAWAGESGYSSILSRRKAIYQEETGWRQQSEEVTSAFPLVGERVRFSRILLGREVPRLAVLWVDDRALPVLRLGALALAAWLASIGLGGRRRAALAGFALLLVVAHYVPGIHRRIVWGLDLALLWLIGREALGGGLATVRARAATPGGLLELLRWRNLGMATLLLGVGGVLAALPLLWSTILLATLAWRWRSR